MKQRQSLIAYLLFQVEYLVSDVEPKDVAHRQLLQRLSGEEREALEHKIVLVVLYHSGSLGKC